MAFFPDFSPYRYLRGGGGSNVVNIGWLDAAYPFEKANTPDEIIEKLWKYCEWSINETRGYHICNLPGCENRDLSAGPVLASRGGTTLELGVAEIRVFGNDGKIYAAPNLIYHYVTEHGYKLPDPFLAALMEAPNPDSAENFDRLGALGVEWTTTLRVGCEDKPRPRFTKSRNLHSIRQS